MLTAARPGSRPIFLVGSSRSGTGIVARLLRHSGLFMGADLESNAESKTMQQVNRWILLNAGGGLETPHGMHTLLADRFVRQAVGDVVHAHVYGSAGWRYWGLRRLSPPARWGFKDPRTTFTLPIWLDLFPEAQVIHVLRHGVDVAISLRDRRKRVERRWDNDGAPEPGALVAQHRVVANLRVRALSDGFKHWQTYVDHACTYQSSLPPAQFHTVRYESLIWRPSETAGDLSAFLGHRVRSQGLHMFVDRVGAHMRQRDTLAFADAARPALQARGY